MLGQDALAVRNRSLFRYCIYNVGYSKLRVQNQLVMLWEGRSRGRVECETKVLEEARLATHSEGQFECKWQGQLLTWDNTTIKERLTSLATTCKTTISHIPLYALTVNHLCLTDTLSCSPFEMMASIGTTTRSKKPDQRCAAVHHAALQNLLGKETALGTALEDCLHM